MRWGVIHNVNGILNLFAHWQAADGNRIPEHMREMMPPRNIMIPIDGLLGPRTEAVQNRDPRALPLPFGGYKRVQRTDWHEGADSPPIYASEKDAVAGRLMGAVVLGGRIWWLTCEPERLEAREWSYRVWNALLHWVSTIGPALIERYPEAFRRGIRGAIGSVRECQLHQDRSGEVHGAWPVFKGQQQRIGSSRPG